MSGALYAGVLPAPAHGRMRIDNRPAAQRHTMNASQTAAAVWIIQSGRAVTVCFKNIGDVPCAQDGDISRRRVGSWEAVPVLYKPEVANRMTENADADAAAAELRPRTTFRMRHDFLGCCCDMADMRSHLPRWFEF